MSKGGVGMLTVGAALDVAPYGLRVNAVGSVVVGRPLGHRDMAGWSYENDRFTVGHIGAPEDVAAAVRFRVSDDAAYVAGAMIPVDAATT